MATKYLTLDPVTVTTAGTPVVLSSSVIYASSIILEGDTLNTGNCYWGDSNVSATKGNSIKAEQPYAITADLMRHDLSHGNNQKLDMSQIYIDADTNGNKVRVSYLPWNTGL